MTGITENVTGITEIMVALNRESTGLLGIAILFSVFIIVFIIFKKTEQDTKEVFLTDAVLTSILAVLLFAIGMIKLNILIFPILLIFVAAMIKKFS